MPAFSAGLHARTVDTKTPSVSRDVAAFVVETPMIARGSLEKNPKRPGAMVVLGAIRVIRDSCAASADVAALAMKMVGRSAGIRIWTS